METEDLARELVRALRGKRSQTAFSRRLGYKSNVAYTWEAGRRWPTAAKTLRAAARVGIDVPGALARFYRTRPPWLDEVDPTTREGVARLLRDLQGRTPIVRLASTTGTSRFAIARFLSGKAEPSLPEFLALVEASSLRLLDLVATLADPAALPSAREAWQRLEAQRRIAYELPWTQAVLRAIELADYRALREHRPEWIAARLGLAPELEAPCLEALAGAGEIRWDGARWIPVEPMAVDTRRDAASGRRLKAHWARVGLDRIDTDTEGLFSYNVFTVSAADLERLRELHLGYFRALRALVAESAPAERVVVANVQLFSLDHGS